MFKRIFWLFVGLGAGATASILVARWARQQRERYSPANVSKRAGESVARAGSRLGDALAVFRTASAEREAEIRAHLDD